MSNFPKSAGPAIVSSSTVTPPPAPNVDQALVLLDEVASMLDGLRRQLYALIAKLPADDDGLCLAPHHVGQIGWMVDLAIEKLGGDAFSADPNDWLIEKFAHRVEVLRQVREERAVRRAATRVQTSAGSDA